MFINHTNHLSQYWSHAQLTAACEYGDILDLPFPSVDPQASSSEVLELAQEYAGRIIALHPSAVLCQGGICLLSCSSRAATGRRNNCISSHSANVL